jgi:hypothetical protein
MKLAGIVRQLEVEQDRVKAEVQKLDAALAAVGSLNGSRGARRGRKPMSAAARRRIAAAQRARWAKFRGRKAGRSKSPISIRSERHISAAGLAKIRAAQRARWAKWKQQQKAA